MAESALPLLAFRQLGYRCVADSAGGRAGVAILTRLSLTEVARGLPLTHVEHATAGRRVRARVGGVWVESLYVPTRKAVGKVSFLKQLARSYQEQYRSGEPLVVCGDFNICLDERDFASPNLIAEPDHFSQREEDLAMQRLLALDLHDCFRKHQHDSGHYTWFDYRPWTVRRNYGMRLDYIFATASLHGACVKAWHATDIRALEKPSDHVPVLAQFEASSWCNAENRSEPR